MPRAIAVDGQSAAFLTDGRPDGAAQAGSDLVAASEHPVFLRTIGLGDDRQLDVLEELDDLPDALPPESPPTSLLRPGPGWVGFGARAGEVVFARRVDHRRNRCPGCARTQRRHGRRS